MSDRSASPERTPEAPAGGFAAASFDAFDPRATPKPRRGRSIGTAASPEAGASGARAVGAAPAAPAFEEFGDAKAPAGPGAGGGFTGGGFGGGGTGGGFEGAAFPGAGAPAPGSGAPAGGTFKGEDFAVDAAKVGAVPPKGAGTGAAAGSGPAGNPAPGSDGDFKSDDLSAGPSLGYLFNPFDPRAPRGERTGQGAGRGAGPDSGEPERGRDYAFRDLDLRDQNIINTLDRAQRKAKQIVYEAFEQGRRLEERMLEAARLEAADLASGSRSEAEAEARGIVEAARGEAAGIVAAAEAKAAAVEDALAAALAGRADVDAKMAEVGAANAALDARAGDLAAREAAMAAREAEIGSIRRDAEAKRAELEKSFRDESAQTLAKAEAAGRAEGLAKGEAEGRAAARAEVMAKAAGFFKIMDRIGSIWRELWRREAPFMAELAVEAAEAIVNKEVENGRGLAAGALEACVEHLHKCHRASFRVRPEDLAEVERARASLRERLDGLVNIEFKPDGSLGPGDLVMESDAGRLDATLKARRARIMDVLKEALAQGLTVELPPEAPEAPAPGKAVAETGAAGSAVPEAAAPESAVPEAAAVAPAAAAPESGPEAAGSADAGGPADAAGSAS